MTNQPAEPHNAAAAASSQAEIQVQQQQQATTSLEPFYEQLLKMHFTDSVSAIEHCRDLCAQYGFTVKQESSMHRNIYVYCSREGLPDSQRNPRSTPKRKRPSKRCDCRWRVVLYEREGRWQFRKSLNPEAAKHNHELMRPEEIDRNWPRKVIDMIYELARTNLPTADIRAKVQAEFPDISWNERRFYNRLSEERTKIRHREAAARARHLTSIWTRLCMAVAGNEELSGYVESEILKLLNTACEMARLDRDTLVAPTFADETPSTVQDQQQQQQEQQEQRQEPIAESSRVTAQGAATSSSAQIRKEPMPRRTSKQSSSASKGPDAPRGFIKVTIPEHSFNVKIHNQKVVNELAKHPRKSRSTDPAADHDAIRKLPRISHQHGFPHTSTLYPGAAAAVVAAPGQHPLYPHPSSSSSFVYQYSGNAVMPQQQQQQQQQHRQEQQQQQRPLQPHPQAPMPYGFTRFQPPAHPTFPHPPPTAYPSGTPIPMQYSPASNEPTIHPALQSDPPAPRQQEEQQFDELLLPTRRQQQHHRTNSGAFTATTASSSSPTPSAGMYVAQPPQPPPTT